MDVEADAVGAYQDALERANILKLAWAELGKPAMAAGSTGQPVPHPLLKAIHEAEVIADRLRERVRVKHRGPQPSAVIRPAQPRRVA